MGLRYCKKSDRKGEGEKGRIKIYRTTTKVRRQTNSWVNNLSNGACDGKAARSKSRPIRTVQTNRYEASLRDPEKVLRRLYVDAHQPINSKTSVALENLSQYEYPFTLDVVLPYKKD